MSDEETPVYCYICGDQIGTIDQEENDVPSEISCNNCNTPIGKLKGDELK